MGDDEDGDAIFYGVLLLNPVKMALRKDEREFFRPKSRFQGVGGMGDDEDGDTVFYGPPENDYGLWREDQFDNLITKCTVNPFVPLGLISTAGVLFWGISSFALGAHPLKSQQLMRWRVICQGFTVLSMALGAAKEVYDNRQADISGRPGFR